MTAIWLWNWGEGVRYAIEPGAEGGYDTVVETGFGSLDREHWDTLDQATAHFRDALVDHAEAGEEGAAGALAALDALSTPTERPPLGE
ncbi:hypothetical protein [Goodfellowiella coeruleoviolacea]|uniref:hypothetical protein n=1 Tax=Goodfellowiella coeruleoviolacea TaxID=334858 RepID=UPI0020A4D1DF|nr:hypothetical protein [Goodfellowiella coeruleoviolacea]